MPFFSFLSPPSFFAVPFAFSGVHVRVSLYKECRPFQCSRLEARLYPGPRLSQQLSAREKQNPDHADTLITSVNSLTRSSSSLFSVWNLSLSLAPESVALFCPHVRRIKHFVCFLRTRLKACVYRWCRLKTNKQTNKQKTQTKKHISLIISPDISFVSRQQCTFSCTDFASVG